MKNILIVSGHTDLNKSFANKIIMNELQQRLLPQAEFVMLDKLYPDFRIDVTTEQQRLVNADIIILQFPFYWYGIPSLMKRWIEDTFTHGFSHGATGNKLHGKKLIMSFTSGAPVDMYRHGGFQNYTIDEFMPPLKQFANLCGMKWQDYVYSGGLSYTSHNNEVEVEQMRMKAVNHAERLATQIKSL